MKFAIISDIHIGSQERGYINGVQRKLTHLAEPLVTKFVNQMNKTEHPEFVVNLGDFIEDISDRDQDISYFKQTKAILDQLDCPTYHVVGNHDQRTLSKQDLKQLLGYDQLYYSFDHGDFHFIILHVELTGNHTQVLSDIKAVISDEQTTWLKTDLQKTNKPTVVFVHYSFADQDLTGNFWFEGQPENCLIENRTDIRKIFEESGKVKAVINGHLHWNNFIVHNNIPYTTVTSIIENFNNNGIPTEAYTIVELTKQQITIDIRGNDPATYKHSFTN